uniref:Uncharacterized protein n=1 Tax=Peronospora matthiolae TaxID=2874970 RepID=A0AAV1UJ32_9STRA
MMPSNFSPDGAGTTTPHSYKPASLNLTRRLFCTDK